MHILFLTDNFPPESNAPATRTFEHAVRWVKAGHAVTVITCHPNFPDGRVFDGYKNKWHSVEHMEGIRVVRVKSYITANEGFALRTLDYLSFMATGTVAALFQKKPDVIVATSPQFFSGVAGMMVAAMRRLPFVLEVRDIWPASIVAVGAMKESLSIRLLEKIELLLYKRATAIVVVTHIFKEEIASKANVEEKISVVLNGVDGAMFYPREKDTELVTSYALNERCVVGYIGTHGLAHDLASVVDAAELIKHRSDIVFMFVGSGAERKNIETMVAERQLSNVLLIGQQPRERMPDFLSVCDISLIPLRDAELFSTVIPSKLFESMGMGIPVLMSLPSGEATGVVQKTGCGDIVAPSNPQALANAISELADNPLKRKTYGEAGLKAAKVYSRDAMAAKLLQVLERVKSDPVQKNAEGR